MPLINEKDTGMPAFHLSLFFLVRRIIFFFIRKHRPPRTNVEKPDT